MLSIEWVGLLGGIISSTSMVPQIVKCIQTKCTKDLSYGSFVILYIGCILSFIYGIFIKHSAIYICALYTIFLNTTLLTTKVYYEFFTTGDSHEYITVEVL